MGLVATPAAWRMVGICIIAVTLLRVYSVHKHGATADRYFQPEYLSGIIQLLRKKFKMCIVFHLPLRQAN